MTILNFFVTFSIYLTLDKKQKLNTGWIYKVKVFDNTEYLAIDYYATNYVFNDYLKTQMTCLENLQFFI